MINRKFYSHVVLATIFIFLLMAGNCLADLFIYTFEPLDRDGDNDLLDLPHDRAFIWGIELALADDEIITGASLFIDDIRNWTESENNLFLSLVNIESGSEGLTIYPDNDNEAVDYFVSAGNVPLYVYKNLPPYSQDLTYFFTQPQIVSLTAFLSDNYFGIGVDPDCHYYNNGFTLTIETTNDPVPESATMLLFGAGISGFASVRMRKKDNRKLFS